jgi:hypothetical protein
MFEKCRLFAIEGDPGVEEGDMLRSSLARSCWGTITGDADAEGVGKPRRVLGKSDRGRIGGDADGEGVGKPRWGRTEGPSSEPGDAMLSSGA